MSKSETPEIAAYPFAARGAGGVVKDLFGGGLLSAAAWALVRFVRPESAELASPLLLAGYAIAGTVMTRAGRELLDSIRQRRQLRQMFGTRPGDDASRRGGADRQEPKRGAPIWSQVVEELRRHKNQYGTTELPALFVGLHGYWRDVLDRRFAVALTLAACPLILGLFAGLDRLELSRPGQWLAGFSSVFLPMIVASIAALLAVLFSLLVRFHWDKTLLLWQETACKEILDQLAIEDVARREDRHEAKAASPAVGGRGNASASARLAPVADIGGKSPQSASVAPAAEATDGWGSFGAAAGVRVKDRRDLNQSDHAGADAHG